MFTQTIDTTIIGGGLSGLYAAFLLTGKKVPFVLLEARDRMTGLITGLVDKIPQGSIRLNSPVCEIERKEGHVLVSVGELEQTPGAQFRSPGVILALPPRLAAASILFTPDLSHELTQAMLRMGTWMAGQAKFYALYPKPYWRQSGLSGQAFSQRGPLGEIHDGSNRDQGPYGLTGFLNIPAAQRNGKNALTRAILVQLAAIYGPSAAKPLDFYYQDWAQEKYTATQLDQPPMYEHPLYQPPAGQTGIWEGRVLFAGSETADQHGGYLEGALESAERAA